MTLQIVKIISRNFSIVLQSADNDPGCDTEFVSNNTDLLGRPGNGPEHPLVDLRGNQKIRSEAVRFFLLTIRRSVVLDEHIPLPVPGARFSG